MGLLRSHTIERSRVRRRYHAPTTIALGVVGVVAAVMSGWVGNRAATGTLDHRKLAAYPEDLFITEDPETGLYDKGDSWTM